MNCPKCLTPDWYSGIFGGNCMNPGCSDWKNGSTGTTTMALASCSPLQNISPVAAPTYKMGDRVEVHIGMGLEGVPDNNWIPGTIVTEVLSRSSHLQAFPRDPYVAVKLDPGYVLKPGEASDGVKFLSYIRDIRPLP